jgi:hypothetical protein
MVPLEHHHLLLPQAVAAHHHLPQAVVVPPPTGPSCPGGSRPVIAAPATAARRTMARHGGGTPTHCSRKPSSWMRDHMPSGTSCNTASRRRRMSSKSLRQPPEEHVMAQHQGHQTDVSSLPSLAQLVAPRRPHADVSLPAAVSPAPDEPTLSATPPRAREVPHLHIQTNNR